MKRLRSLDGAAVFLAALWLVCLYRAITQSIVHDEALTWELYLAGPAGLMFTFFDANHHFLNTLLMRLSTGVLGLSEFSMRVPALCGAALWFVAVHRIAHRLVKSAGLVLLVCAALTLNPIVLDFMVAARGYGMALALWGWAFASMMPLLDGERLTTRELLHCALALSLSVMANLTFLFPVTVLAVCVFYLQRRAESAVQAPPPPAKKKTRDKTAPTKTGSRIWRWFVLPIAVCAVAFSLAAPLDVARSRDFYVGAASLRESLRNLASVSLLYARWARSLHDVRDAVAFVLAPALVVAGLIVGFLRRDRWVFIPSLVAAAAAALLALGHIVTGMPWPVDRTGLYFCVLLMLILVALAARVARPLWIVVGVAALAFAAQFNVRSFYVWEYDADTRTIAEQIAARRGSSAPDSVSVGASWQLEPALNFYRAKNGWTWMQAVDRTAIAPGAGFYALIIPDQKRIAALGLKPVYRGAISGTVLAVPER